MTCKLLMTAAVAAVALTPSIGFGVAEAPYVLAVPQPPSPVLAVDRPPCRETTPEGVVVERGTACSQGAK
jgi:hypothetical protein